MSAGSLIHAAEDPPPGHPGRDEPHRGVAATEPHRVGRLDELTSLLALDDPAGELSLSREAVQRLLIAAVRSYARLADASDAPVPAVAREDTPPSATEVAVTVVALMRSVQMEPFELGMWWHTSAIPRPSQ